MGDGSALDERVKASFDFAQESTKQMITLATGIIALTITFQKDFLNSSSIPAQAKFYAPLSWLLFLLSVIFGLWTLLALAGSLDPKNQGQPSIYGMNIIIPSIMEILCFIAGLSLTVWYGYLAIR
jgi:hypothetical protein